MKKLDTKKNGDLQMGISKWCALVLTSMVDICFNEIPSPKFILIISPSTVSILAKTQGELKKHRDIFSADVSISSDDAIVLFHSCLNCNLYVDNSISSSCLMYGPPPSVEFPLLCTKYTE